VTECGGAISRRFKTRDMSAHSYSPESTPPADASDATGRPHRGSVCPPPRRCRARAP
jgi:hypothetical protein